MLLFAKKFIYVPEYDVWHSLHTFGILMEFITGYVSAHRSLEGTFQHCRSDIINCMWNWLLDVIKREGIMFWALAGLNQGNMVAKCFQRWDCHSKKSLSRFMVSLAVSSVALNCWIQQSCSSSSKKDEHCCTRYLYRAPSAVDYPFTDEAQTALFKDPVRTAL